MGKAELDVGIDPERLGRAKRLGVAVAGMSETPLRPHLQKAVFLANVERRRLTALVACAPPAKTTSAAPSIVCSRASDA
jgi:hypothetical protein